MPRASDFPLLLPAIREDLRDYRIPGSHLHGPLARGVARLPSGREVPAPDDGDAGIPGIPSGPSVRLWPFAIAETTPNAAVVVSPALVGPALIDFARLMTNNDTGIPRPVISIRYSENPPLQGSNQLIAAGALGTDIITGPVVLDEPGGQYQAADLILRNTFGEAAATPQHYDLRYPIYLSRFFINIALGTQGAGNQFLAGYLRIIEGLTRADLRSFL